MKNNDVLLRVKELISDFGLSDGKFADKIKMDRSGFSKRMTGAVAAGEGFINRIVMEIGVNKQWLLYGTGDKYPKPIGGSSELSANGINLVPVVLMSAPTKYIESRRDVEFVRGLRSMPVVTDADFKGRYMAFQVTNDAMVDGTSRSILSNDIVLGREVDVDMVGRYSESMHDKLFVIVYNEGIVLRKLVEFSARDEVVVFAALNPLYSSLAIRTKDIVELYNAVRVIDREI